MQSGVRGLTTESPPARKGAEVASLIAHYGLPIVALIIFAGEIGLPTLIPGEIGLLIAGNQDIRTVGGLVLAIAVFGAVDLIATCTIHVAARTGGNNLLRKVVGRIGGRRRSPESVIHGYRARLGGHDSLFVFCARLIPIFRLYASIATGLIRVDFRRFLAGAAPAAWLWASIPLTIGFVLRSELGPVVSQYSTVTSYIIPASVALTAFIALVTWLRHRTVMTVVVAR